MKKSIFIVVLMMAFVLLNVENVRAQSYEQMWAQLEKYEKDDLPKQVISQAEQILEKAQKEKQFAQMMRAWKTVVERKTDIEPDSFKVCIEHIGSKLRDQKAKSFSPVQNSVYNAILGSAYGVMRTAGIMDSDRETFDTYMMLSDVHFQKVLVDMNALAKEKSADYAPLLKVFNADSKLFDNDMLSIMIDFVMENASFSNEKKIEIYSQAADLYKQMGNNNAYTILTMKKFSIQRNILNARLKLSYQEYKDCLKALLNESQDIETGADVAQRYLNDVSMSEDEKLEFIRWAREKYNKSYCASYFDRQEKSLLTPNCHITMKSSTSLASRPFTLSFSGTNIENINFKIRKFIGYDKNGNLKKDGKIIQEYQYPLITDQKNIERHQKKLVTHFSFDKDFTLPAGKYVVVADGNGCENAVVFHVTSLRAFCFAVSANKSKVVVVDNETGRPVSNVYLVVTTIGDNTYKVLCDKNGEALVNNKDYYFVAYKNDDDFTEHVSISTSSEVQAKGKRVNIKLFSDRSIYRPGQTVQLSGVVYQQQGDDTNVLSNYSNDVCFYDVNRQLIEKKSVRTDDMGTFSTDFIIPKDRLPGSYSLVFGSSSINVKVEEYKRPTFKVSMLAEESGGTQLTFGDSMNVKVVATAYSGVPVQDATVKYTIKLTSGSFWTIDNNSWKTLKESELKTDENGIALIPLLLDDSKYNEYSSEMVRYKVYADITDVAGETHSAEYTKSLSKRGFSLYVRAEDVIDLAKNNTIEIVANNCNGDIVPVTGEYKLYLSNNAEKYSCDTIKGAFTTEEPIKLPALTPGNYTMRVWANDKNNNLISEYRQFVVFNSKTAVDFFGKNKGERTFFEKDFLYCKDPTFGENKPAEFYFAPCVDDAYVYYCITNNDTIVESGNVVLDNSLLRIPVNYKSNYGDGVTFHIFYVKDGHQYYYSQVLTYVLPNKKLTLSWKTFRDKLQPGQKEEWILNIKDHTGKSVNGACLLATMYDKSLDAIYPHYLSFYTYYSRLIRTYRMRESSANSFNSLYLSGPSVYTSMVNRYYDQFNKFSHQRWYNGRYAGAAVKARAMVESAPVLREVATGNQSEGKTVMDEAEDLDMVESVDNSKKGEVANVIKSESNESQTAVRSNFNETAFFMPHIMTDANGDAHISFTLPESLTEWKFLGVAHTKDVQYGNITATTIAQKDFMVQPNLPRFVRDGDKANISARVINRSDKNVSGVAYMRLIDPETEKIVLKKELPFSLQSNKTISVDFDFVASIDYPLLICEVVGETKDFSDGERDMIPVLTSKKYVTESIPFYIDKQTEDNSQPSVSIDLSNIFNQNSATATKKQMTFEFTENPEWSIIESLKAIRLPKYDNAPAFGASLYSNYMANQLVSLVPGLKDAVELGLKRQENQSEINSNLADNQVLKDILLQESPWVLDALGEEQTRTELLDYFNEHLINSRITTACEKLHKLQLSDGSWSWFEGMKGSYYITLSVAEQLAYLLNATAAGREMKPTKSYSGKNVANLLSNASYMVYKSMNFLDEQELKEYDYRKKNKYSLMPSNSTLRYLYLSTILPHHKESKRIVEMREAYLKEIEKDVKNLTIYGRANAALLLRHYGHNKYADKFMQSVIEYSVYKPDMGRYYSTDNAYYSWLDYRIPTQIAVMRSIKGQESAINTILRTMGDKQDAKKMLNDMQIWLLRQKQTQIWDNPITIVDVIDFMLKSRQDENGNTLPFNVSKQGPKVVLHGNNTSVQIETPLDTTKFLAEQLGYVKTIVDSTAYSNGVSSMDVSITTPEHSGSISWGAVYTQYLEDLDRLQSSSSGELKVDIKYYLVPQGSQDKSQEITDSNTIIHVGDKVTTRVIVTADRDMDFVQIRAQHPACFEPKGQLSGYRWMNGRGGYVSHHDSHTDIFYDTFRKGTTTIDLDFYVNRTGMYQAGIVTAQCAYAPEYVGHTAGRKVSVK